MLIIITQAHPKSNPQIQEFFRHPSLPPNPTISQPPSAPFSPSPPPHTPHQNAPLFAAVESDIVGYTTIEMQANYNQRGVCFKGLGNEDTISFNDLLSGDFQDGDQIQLLKGAGEAISYDRYRYVSGQGWMIGRSSADVAPVKPGDCFWFLTDRPLIVTFKGAVAKGDFLYEASQGLQMVAANIPTSFALNPVDDSVVWTNLSEGDEIQWLNELGGYDRCRYAGGKWRQGRTVTDKVIPAGSAIWLVTSSENVTLLIRNPIE